MKKIIVFVYRYGSDCTGGGATSRHDRMLLFYDCTRDEAVEYCEENGIDVDSALYIEKRELWGENHDFATPLVQRKGVRQFGGNFIYSSDSRFPRTRSRFVSEPIPVHDRFETQEEYDMYSI